MIDKGYNHQMNIKETTIHHSQPRFIKVAGSHREIGQQIGESCRDLVVHSIDSARNLLDATYEHLQLDWNGAAIQARKYIPFAEERYPQYVEELRGIAEGANVEFDEVSIVNAMEAVTMDALHLTKCTSLAVNGDHTANGHVLLAHNEDWLPEDENDVIVIHAKPIDEPAFLAMTYGALLPNIGFNSLGIAQACDSVYPNDTRIGIPRVVASRAVLAARTIDAAIRAMVVPLRAAGYNHLLAHESGEIYNIEVSARHFAPIYSETGIIAHTNHFLAANMQAIEHEPDELISTRIRYNRAIRMLNKSTEHTILSLQSILKDHTNFPDAICNHCMDEIDPMDREKTICSLVMDLTARQMHIAWGNPCRNSYHTFQLDSD